MIHQKKKEEAEFQTVLISTPHILSKGDVVLVRSNQSSQTVASAPPSVPDEDLYDHLQHVDVADINKNSIKFKVEDTFSASLVTSATTRESDSDEVTFRSKEGYEHQGTQTRLMVFPHFLSLCQRATISCEVTTQTTESYKAESSLFEIIPKLQAYLDHSSHQEITAGDNASNRSILDMIKELLNEVDRTHKRIDESTILSTDSSNVSDNINQQNKRKLLDSKQVLKTSCQTCEQGTVQKLRKQKLLNQKCVINSKYPEMKSKFEHTDLFPNLTFDQCIPCQEEYDKICHIKLMQNISKDETLPPVTIVYTPRGSSVPMVQQSKAETVIYYSQNSDCIIKVANHDTTLIQTAEGDDVLIQTETSYNLSTSCNEEEYIKEDLSAKGKNKIVEENGDCLFTSGDKSKNCQQCLCNGLKINLCIKNFGTTSEEDPNKISLDLNLLPGFKKVEVKEITREEEKPCPQNCCPGKYSKDTKFEKVDLAEGKQTTFPSIIKRIENENKIYSVEDGQKDCYCDMLNRSCYEDKKKEIDNEDEENKEEKQKDLPGIEFCEKTIVKKKKSSDILKCRAMSISNLLEDDIMTLVSKNKEGFNVLININNPTLQGDQINKTSSQETTEKCGCTSDNKSTQFSPINPTEEITKCRCTSKECKCANPESESIKSEPFSYTEKSRKCSCTSLECEYSNPESKYLKSEIVSSTKNNRNLSYNQTVTDEIDICEDERKRITYKPIIDEKSKSSIPETFDTQNVPPLKFDSPRSDNEYDTCSEGLSPFFTPHCFSGESSNIHSPIKNDTPFFTPKTEDIFLSPKKEDMHAISEPKKPSQIKVEQSIPCCLTRGTVTKCASCSEENIKLTYEYQNDKEKCQAICNRNKLFWSPHNYLDEDASGESIEKKEKDEVVAKLRTGRKLDSSQPIRVSEEYPADSVQHLNVPNPPLLKVSGEYLSDSPLPEKVFTQYPPNPPLPEKVLEEYSSLRKEERSSDALPSKVYDSSLYKGPENYSSDSSVSLGISEQYPLNSSLPIGKVDSSSTSKNVSVLMPPNHLAIPESSNVPSAQTMFRLSNNTVLNVQLTQDADSTPESITLRREKVVSETSDVKSSLAIQTGVLPIITEKIFDTYKLNAKELPVSYGHEENSFLYCGLSNTVNILPTTDASYESIKLENKISASNEIEYNNSKMIHVIKDIDEKTPNINEKCNCPYEHLCKTSSKTSKQSSGSKKSKHELENKDIVFMAYKTCEEELKPAIDALKNIKEELRKLNMPEVNCIFKETEIFSELPKYNFTEERLHRFKTNHLSTTQITKIRQINTKCTSSQDRIRTRIKFNYISPNKSTSKILTATTVTCKCIPQNSRPVFEVINTISQPKLMPDKKQARCKYKNSDLSDSGWSIPKIYSTFKIKSSDYRSKDPNIVHPKHTCCCSSVSSSKLSQVDSRLCCHRHVGIRFADKTDSSESCSLRKVPNVSKECASHHYTKINMRDNSIINSKIKIFDSKVKNSTSTSTYQSRSKHKNAAYDSAYCSYPTTSSVYPIHSLSKHSVPESFYSHTHEKAVQSDKYSANSLSAHASFSQDDQSISSTVSSYVSSEEFVCPAKHKSKKAGKKGKHKSRCSCASSVMSECPFLEAMKSVLFTGQHKGSKPQKKERRQRN